MAKNKAERIEMLGMRIKELRESQGLSQSDLAASIGKDQQSINRLEAGGMNPTYYYLLEVAEGLNISISELLNIDPSKKKKK